MVFKPTAINARAAFTLAEMVVAVALGTVLLLGLVSVYSFSVTSFTSMSNYAELDQSSRSAGDLISRDVRNATSVDITTTSNQLILNITDGTKVAYAYDPSAKTLVRVVSGQTNTLLKNVQSLNFALYQRPTNTSLAYEDLPPANTANAKFVAFQWECSRAVVGSQIDSQGIQTALVDLRNQ
jgi:hypothetical protein